jgi:hypothetical protein
VEGVDCVVSQEKAEWMDCPHSLDLLENLVHKVCRSLVGDNISCKWSSNQ